MPPTIPGPLTRPIYSSSPPGPYNAAADPTSPDFLQTPVLASARVVSAGNLFSDIEQYQRPLEQLHAGGLHAPGIAFGMQITCTPGDQNVVVLPGLAVDSNGRHIFLAVGGFAEIAPNASFVPPVSSTLWPSPKQTPSGRITAAGVTLPTAPLTGELYIVVQWRETFDNAGYVNNPNLVQFLDTPWLQLVTAANYQPDQQVILGKVVLGAGSTVISAGYGDVGGLQRTMVSLPAQSVQLYRAITTGAPGADTAAWGELRAREGGGIEVTVPNGDDQVTLMREDGGSFGTLAVAADQANFGDLANPGIVADGGEATMQVGAPGNWGEVLVYDENSHLAVSLIGHTGQVVIGGETLDGKVRMLNANAADTMSLDGDTGAAVVQQLNAFDNIIDVNARFLKIHGWDLWLDGRSGTSSPHRALVDGGNRLLINYAGDYGTGVEVQSNLSVDGILVVRDSLFVNGTVYLGNQIVGPGDVPLMGNPARKVMSCTLFAGCDDFSNIGSPYSHTVDLGAETQFTAYTSITYIQQDVNDVYGAAGAAGIIEVDGKPVPNNYNSNIIGPIFPQFVSQVGRTIKFQVKAGGNSIAFQATLIVFYE